MKGGFAVDWNKLSRPAPLDDDGFMTSFPADDVDGWLGFMRTFGFCVLNVFSKAEMGIALDEFWADVSARGNGLHRDDPHSWDTENWPTRSKFLTTCGALTQSAFDIRTSDKLYSVFRVLYGGEERLWCNVDNWGVFRGTVFDWGERADWRWQLDPHWDVDPWRYMRELSQEGLPPQYQALVALTDCPESSGGFRVCPGSSVHLAEYVARFSRPATAGDKDSFHPSEKDPWRKRLQKVPIKQGSVIIWDSGALHANFENHGPDMRIVQYVRMFPAACVCDAPSRRRLFPTSQSSIRVDGINLSPLGRKLLALDPWN